MVSLFRLSASLDFPLLPLFFSFDPPLIFLSQLPFTHTHTSAIYFFLWGTNALQLIWNDAPTVASVSGKCVVCGPHWSWALVRLCVHDESADALCEFHSAQLSAAEWVGRCANRAQILMCADYHFICNSDLSWRSNGNCETARELHRLQVPLIWEQMKSCQFYNTGFPGSKIRVN